MDNLETALVQNVVYTYTSAMATRLPVIGSENQTQPQPPVNPDEVITKLNDYFKTYLRFKCEAKYIAGEKPKYYVSYKDNNKNPHTFYFEVY